MVWDTAWAGERPCSTCSPPSVCAWTTWWGRWPGGCVDAAMRGEGVTAWGQYDLRRGGVCTLTEIPLTTHLERLTRQDHFIPGPRTVTLSYLCRPDTALHCLCWPNATLHCLCWPNATPQQTWDAGPTLVYCWANVVDGGPTVKQRWANVSCFLGLYCLCRPDTLSVSAWRGTHSL